MMNFLHKHILIPEEYKVAYYYLLFLIPSLIGIWPLNNLRNWLSFFLIFVFYKLYRDGYVEKLQTDRLMLWQLVIAAVLTLIGGQANVFIFFAWGFNFWNITDKTRRKYFTWYYVSAIISIGISLWLGRNDIESKDYVWIWVGTAFVLISPIMASVVAKEQMRAYQLSMNNARLETIIRNNERDRIARDLHDNLGQSYSTMTIKAELAAKLVHKKPEQAIQEMNEIAQMSRKDLNLVRNIVRGLQERTIATAMIEADQVLKQKDILLLSKNESITENWEIETQYVLASVIKEATTNILRHSQANQAIYRFNETPTTYEVILEDNGRGGLSEDKYNFGLNGIVQRLNKVNGTLSIANNPGAKLTIRIPKEG